MFLKREDGPRGTLGSRVLYLIDQNASKVQPASGTGSNLLPLFALLTDEMPIAALEDSTRWRHHLSWKMSQVEI